jgi:hypothetical protein
LFSRKIRVLGLFPNLAARLKFDCSTPLAKRLGAQAA